MSRFAFSLEQLPAFTEVRRLGGGLLGLALVWALCSDRWGDPVHTHGSLAPFWGEAVRGSIRGVLGCLVLLSLLSSVCVCTCSMPLGTVGKDALWFPA